MLILWQFGDINIVLAVDKQAAEGHIMRRESATASFPFLHILFFFFVFKKSNSLGFDEENPYLSGLNMHVKWLVQLPASPKFESLRTPVC